MDTVESYSSAEAEIRLRAKYRASTQEDADWLLAKVDGLRARVDLLKRDQCTHHPVPMPYIPNTGNPVPMPTYPGQLQIWCSVTPDETPQRTAEQLGFRLANTPI